MKYVVTTRVIDASGFQEWLVEADSKEDALRVFNETGGEPLAEEIEVTSISKPGVADVHEHDDIYDYDGL